MPDQHPKKKADPWFREMMTYGFPNLDFLLLPLLIVGLLAFLLLPALAAAKRAALAKSLVVYCAQDQTYAESLLKDFERETGIKVRSVFDSEAVKTVGLANRLLAEREHPQADIFWGNEEFRTRQLAGRGVFRATNGWAAFGHRSRRIVINTKLVPLKVPTPKSLLELTNALWRGKVALAYPQFGTTSTHFHALRQAWGETAWLAWCRALAANQPRLVDGNSVVVQTVGRGEAAIGLTDSDDIIAGQREGLPVAALPLSPESLLIPNTVAVIHNAPHQEAAEKLFAWLQRPAVAKRLVEAGALEAAEAQANSPTLQPDWPALLRDLESTTEKLNSVFLR